MEPPRREERWGRRELLERTAPFAVVVALAFATVPLSAQDSDDALVAVAAALTIALVAAVALVPWRRLPSVAGLAPAFGGLVIVAILRHAEGGADSNYGVLVLAPVVWLALYGTRKELVAMIVAVALVFLVPVLAIGPPEYPDSEWQRALIVCALAAFIGLVTQSLVGEVRARAREAERRAHSEAEREEYLHAVMDSAAEGIVAVDREGKATFVNPAAARLCGYEIDELVGRNMHEAVHHTRPDGSPYPAEECPQFQALRTGEPITVSDEVFWRKDGTSFPVEYSSTAMVVDGEITGTVTSFFDITERLAAQRTKDEFVSVVSHELRTPLTSIRGSLGLLEGGVVGELPDEAQKMISLAVSNADRLARLIDDILDVERMEAGDASMEPRSVDLADLMTRSGKLVAGAADEAGVAVEIDPLEAVIHADPDRIAQTLVNLVENAIKFSGEGTTVRVHGEIQEDDASAGTARIYVRDEGPGIPAEQQEEIFERFVQVDSAATRAQGGSGLGLWLAQRIVEQHDGRIWLESSTDAGTAFAFELPLARRPEREHSAGVGEP